jgi:FkbM family methyltransferase
LVNGRRARADKWEEARRRASRDGDLSVLDSLKQMVIHTPLERPLQRLRYIANFPKRRRHPELAELYAEAGRVDAFLAKLLKRDSNCLDVGCHLGSFLSLLLRYAPGGKHMAFEALPEKAERLKKKFPGVQIVQGAVGDKPGEITFYQDLTYSGYSGMNVQRDYHQLSEVKVRCETLDNLVPADRHIEFMKVDVEGAETLVLQGATKLIGRCKPVILFECTPDGLKGAKQSAADVYNAFVEGLNYRVYLIKDFAGRGEPLTVESFRKSMQYPALARNYIATPPDRKPLGAQM